MFEGLVFNIPDTTIVTCSTCDFLKCQFSAANELQVSYSLFIDCSFNGKLYQTELLQNTFDSSKFCGEIKDSFLNGDSFYSCTLEGNITSSHQNSSMIQNTHFNDCYFPTHISSQLSSVYIEDVQPSAPLDFQYCDFKNVTIKGSAAPVTLTLPTALEDVQIVTTEKISLDLDVNIRNLIIGNNATQAALTPLELNIAPKSYIANLFIANAATKLDLNATRGDYLTLKNVQLPNSTFNNCDINSISAEQTDWQGTVFKNSTIVSIYAISSNFTNWDADDFTLNNLNTYTVDFTGSCFRNSRIGTFSPNLGTIIPSFLFKASNIYAAWLNKGVVVELPIADENCTFSYVDFFEVSSFNTTNSFCFAKESQFIENVSIEPDTNTGMLSAQGKKILCATRNRNRCDNTFAPDFWTRTDTKFDCFSWTESVTTGGLIIFISAGAIALVLLLVLMKVAAERAQIYLQRRGEAGWAGGGIIPHGRNDPRMLQYEPINDASEEQLGADIARLSLFNENAHVASDNDSDDDSVADSTYRSTPRFKGNKFDISVL